MDKATQAYWERHWAGRDLPGVLDPARGGLGHYVDRRFHELFSRVLSDRDGGSLLELGCAQSSWLPYFALRYGLHVTGIDYSPTGCERARDLLEKASVTGSVVCADFFAPPEQLLERFDYVVSYGVVEHFTDTTSTIAAFSRYLKPGGLMITIIPNLTGLMGALQRFLNRSIYDIHVPISREVLRQAHQDARLSVTECDYFLATSFAMCNLGPATRSPKVLFKRVLLSALVRFSMLLWWVEERTARLPANRLISPYIICTAIK